MNLHNVCQIWSRSVQLFGIYPTFLNVWPLTPSQMPLGVSSPLICLAYVHSQMNLHTCAEFGSDRSSCLPYFLHFWICDPLIPYKCPLMSRGVTFLTYIHSEMNLHTYAKFGPDRSSGLESFLDLWLFYPINPPKCHLGCRGVNSF